MYIYEIPLTVNQEIWDYYYTACRIHCNIYNSIVAEALRRFDVYYNSQEYKDAIVLYKTQNKTKQQTKDMKELFKKAKTDAHLNGQHIFSKFITGKSKLWEGSYISSSMLELLGHRIETIINNHWKNPRLYGVPSFCSVKDFTTIQGNKNTDKIRYIIDENKIRFFEHIIKIDIPTSKDTEYDRWCHFQNNIHKNIDGVYKKGKKKGQVCVEGSTAHCPISNIRLTKKTFNGTDRLYIQVSVKGEPYSDIKKVEGKVALDMGPSFVAIVADTKNGPHAEIYKLMEFINDIDSQKRVIQRYQDRSMRKNNPTCFKQDGTYIKGKKIEKRSNGYYESRHKLNDLERRLNAHRKNEHGRLSNYIVSNLGTDIHIEDLSYRAWSGLYGRQIKRNAPGMLIANLKRKANVNEINTFKSKLSQRCACGWCSGKKDLNDRVFICDKCGKIMQRDLMSSYLALFTTVEGITDFQKADSEWNRFYPVLFKAWSDAQKYNNSSIGKLLLTSTTSAI